MGIFKVIGIAGLFFYKQNNIPGPLIVFINIVFKGTGTYGNAVFTEVAKSSGEGIRVNCGRCETAVSDIVL